MVVDRQPRYVSKASASTAAHCDPFIAPWCSKPFTDHYRARDRHRTDLPLESEPAQPPAEPEASNRNEEVAGWLAAAVENLPDRYRDAVRLYELQGVSQAEVAERLGISLSGAKSRVQRGRQKLKHVLQRCCRFDLDRRGYVLSCEPNTEGCSYCE